MARIGAVRPLSKLFAVATMPFWLALAQAQQPASPDDTAAQLGALADEIQAIQQKLDAQEKERSTLQQALREAELQISKSDQRLAEVMQAQEALQQQLTQLDNQRTRLLVAQRGRTDIIEQGIQQLWAVQQGGGLRVWLGDQDPQKVARHLAYLERIVEDQQVIIAEYQQALLAIGENRKAAADTQSQLDIQRETLADAQRALADQQAVRQQAIADISATLQTDQQRLAELERDQVRLNALLGEIQDVAVRSENLSPANLQPFADTRGTLAMPVNGAPANRFGERRNAEIRWRGWLISAEQGEPVQAVHGGRVIYSDWLRGQGLLVVIDHGDGWLSLYARNHSLLRRVGDRVKSGDLVARAGASGGSEASGLYFEIRRDGKPVDPADWIRR